MYSATSTRMFALLDIYFQVGCGVLWQLLVEPWRDSKGAASAVTLFGQFEECLYHKSNHSPQMKEGLAITVYIILMQFNSNSTCKLLADPY